MEFQERDSADVPVLAGWPFGDTMHDPDLLAVHLCEVGKLHSRRALALYISDDGFQLLNAAYSIGSAVELLAKALLASISPTLLLPAAATVDSILRFAGATNPGQQSPPLTKVKSLEAQQCMARLGELDIGPDWSKADSEAVFGVRNIAAHLGLVDRTALSAALRPMVRFSEYVRDKGNVEPEEWWGTDDASRTAGKILTDELSEWRWAYQAKVSAARDYFSQHFGGLPANADTLLEALQNTHPVLGEYGEQSRCPACNYLGWAFGSSETWGVDMQDQSGTSSLHEPFGYTEFVCNVCRLHLKGSAELKLGHIPIHMEGTH